MRENKPDLLFMLTLAVAAGVLLTSLFWMGGLPGGTDGITAAWRAESASYLQLPRAGDLSAPVVPGLTSTVSTSW